MINRYNLEACEQDVKTTFLNGIVKKEIFIEIFDGMNVINETRKTNVCKLQKSLYGLRTSPKRWYEKFTTVANSMGIINDGSMFIYTNDRKNKINSHHLR